MSDQPKGPPGKPPGIAPAIPRISPAQPAAPGIPTIRPQQAQPVAPARPASAAPTLPTIAPAQAQVPPRPMVTAAPGAPIAAPPRPVVTAPQAAPPARGPVLTPAIPAPAAARPSGVLVPPGPPPPNRPSGVLVPPGPPTTNRPSGVLIPPAAPARPAGPPPVLVPPGPPVSGKSAVLVPPAAPTLVPPRPPSNAPPMASSGAPAPARKAPIPEAGAIEDITAPQAAELRKMALQLNAQDYFQTLGVPQNAGAGDIKKAFYRESRTYHPDRFFHMPESQVTEDLNTLYKRITEAYYVLRDEAKRKKYLSDITGSDRANKLRYTESTEAEQKAEARKVVEEEFGTNPKARPFFKSAVADIEAKNWSQAERNLKMGLTWEPGNTRFKEKLEEVRKAIEEERRTKGPSFLIK